MSRKHYKLCLSCINYQIVEKHILAQYYFYDNNIYKSMIADVCKLKLTPQSINGCERCDRYKTVVNRRRK